MALLHSFGQMLRVLGGFNVDFLPILTRKAKKSLLLHQK